MNTTVWTVGHSDLSISDFLDLLDAHGIRAVVDVRKMPGSTRYPHFNSDALKKALASRQIEYFHFPDLGGLRKTSPDSPNTAWRNKSFRGYADYMMTPLFKMALDRLVGVTGRSPTALMCAEAVWWRCHRAMISDALKAKGDTVLHILGKNKIDEHLYTKLARIVNGALTYISSDQKDFVF